MKTTTHHFIGDRVSVRCRLRNGIVTPVQPPAQREPAHAQWLAGTIIARDAIRDSKQANRYVVQLDDSRRVVAFDDDLRRWTLCFDVLDVLEKMAS